MKSWTQRERIEYVRGYRWSSYAGYIGRRKDLGWVDSAPIMALIDCAKGERRRRYRQYVEDGLAENDREFEATMKASALCIGSETFQDRIEGLDRQLTGKHKKVEDVSFRRRLQPLPRAEVLEVVAEEFGGRWRHCSAGVGRARCGGWRPGCSAVRRA